MGWTSQLICLGLLVATIGGAGAHLAWVAGEGPSGPHEGRRVARNVGSGKGGVNMVSLAIESKIAYRYARTTMVCSLENTHNVAKDIAFTTNLPNGAFISAFYIEVGGHRHVGKVQTKEEARRQYLEARNAGKTAAEVGQSARDANLFTVNVNVEANEDVTFNLTYDELLVRRLGIYSHAVHIDPGQIVDNLSVKVDIEESNDIRDLNIDPLRPASATTHSGVYKVYNHEPLPRVERLNSKTASIEWNPTPFQQRALKSDGVVGRFVVQYDIERLTHPNQILVHDGYFVHFFAPANLTPMDKHVVFVLDISGSMQGSRITQLKQAMDKILSDLRRGDFFTIIVFSANVQAWRGWSIRSVDLKLNSAVGAELVVNATPDKIREAKRFVQSLKVRGVTNIHDSLAVALKAIGVGQNKFASMSKRPEPMIIFLTDGNPNRGAVTKRKDIPPAIARLNSKQTSIFSLGFGKGIDMNFLKDLSLKNAGFARLIYEGSDAALQLQDFYREVSSPLLKDLKFRYTNVDQSTVTRAGFTTLHSGTELIMSGKLNGIPNAMTSSLEAQSQYGIYRIGFATPEVVNLASPDFMERLWAYLNIKQLLENSNDVNSERVAQQMALKYSFVTPLTSLVVVRPDVPDPSTAITSLKDPRMNEDEDIDIRGLDSSEENETETETETEPNSTEVEETLSLSWDSPQYNGTHVTVTRGRNTKLYLVKSNATEENYTSCRVRDGGWHYCRHVNACLFPDIVADFDKYQEAYFCAISGNFAGVCCPSSPPS